MTNFICVQCGAQFPDSDEPPERCPICDEERQYIHFAGQRWTTLEEMRRTYRLKIADEGEKITGIGSDPPFGINQRALLLQSPAGNVLWDCLALVTDEGVAEVKRRGGATAIAISHPHYYTSMAVWSEALGGIPIYLHADDREWVMRPNERIVHWTGETLPLNDEMTLIRCGGHFAGGAVLHWAGAPGGKGALMSGDILQVVADRKHVSFMYSYPNYIPLNRRTVEAIVAAVEPYAFDSIYGAWWQFVIPTDAKNIVRRSAERYIRAIAE